MSTPQLPPHGAKTQTQPQNKSQVGQASLTILPTLTIGAESDVGKKRAKHPNQDAIGLFSETPVESSEVLKKGMLFVVADGMGWPAGGEEASQIAVETTMQAYYASADKPDIKRRLEQSIQAANIQIYQRGHEGKSSWEMGSTIVAAVIQDSQLVVAHVGDSRAYLFRQAQLKQLTTDHTLAQGLLNLGLITAKEVPHHPRRHILSRSLGHEETVSIEMQTCTLQEGDVILLCSNGLSDVLCEPEISDVLHSQQAHQAAHRLVEIANEHGGPDNISVIVLHIERLSAAQR